MCVCVCVQEAGLHMYFAKHKLLYNIELVLNVRIYLNETEYIWNSILSIEEI